MAGDNLDPRVVEHFGAEWSKFDQSGAAPDDLAAAFDAYFSIFPWDRLPDGAVGADVGCGTGRWARFVAPRVGELHCVEPSPAALDVARRALAGQPNCRFHQAGMAAVPLPDGSLDFAYSLGVLHVVPDPPGALAALAAKLRPGAPLLVYAMYALDDRPTWFRALWRAADGVRRVVSRLPHRLRRGVTEVVAVAVYWPLARFARWRERQGADVAGYPLAEYRDAGLYRMRTDALDRFGSPRETRFTAAELRAAMEAAGLAGVRLSPEPPFWCAVGFRAGASTP